MSSSSSSSSSKTIGKKRQSAQKTQKVSETSGLLKNRLGSELNSSGSNKKRGIIVRRVEGIERDWSLVFWGTQFLAASKEITTEEDWVYEECYRSFIDMPNGIENEVPWREHYNASNQVEKTHFLDLVVCDIVNWMEHESVVELMQNYKEVHGTLNLLKFY